MKIANLKKFIGRPPAPSGAMLIVALVATGLFLTITMGAIGLAVMQQKLNIKKIARAQALHVAEAGVNYYRWVLYHDKNEYCNKEACKNPGNGFPEYGPYGPFDYTDAVAGTITGRYELYITPPPQNGSTIVNIRSVGWVTDHPETKREIEVECGIPSWSTYSALANDEIRFGVGTEVWGPIHSNEGIRFDGIAHNVVTSYRCHYDDPDHSGNNDFGVHTHDSPADPTQLLPYDDNCPPGNVPVRDDVFIAGRSFPEGLISFDLLNNHAAALLDMATSAGLLFDPRPAGTAESESVAVYRGCGTAGSSCDEGFHITLRTDNQFDIRGVTSTWAPSPSDSDCLPSKTIGTQEATVRTYPIPANGVIFVKHHVWVSGTGFNGRVTIAAFEGDIDSGIADINITNDITYDSRDGTDAIGLIAQNDVNIGLVSEIDLEVDAALLAQNGRVGRYNYSGCTPDVDAGSTITVYGTIATFDRYGFQWLNSTTGVRISGYDIRNLIYDNNLTFAPPPHYPTTGEYTFISWKEE